MLKYRGVGQVLLARSWRWWLPLFIGITFLSVSLRFGGPAYQQDEIGYLVNAAFFAGYVVDGYSSYHAGYSLFLAPLFAFLGDPDDVWKGVLVVNALFWVGTFYLLTQLLEDLLPAATSKRRLLAIAVAATYPAWVVMAGYAFSQSAFAFFYVAAVLSLLRWRPDKPASILMHSGLVGFLFWIHPTAWGVVLASVASVGLASWTVHRYRSPTCLVSCQP